MTLLGPIFPLDPARVHDPDHWRDKAEEARLAAEEIRDPVARETMEHVAGQYERLAEHAEAYQAARSRPMH